MKNKIIDIAKTFSNKLFQKFFASWFIAAAFTVLPLNSPPTLQFVGQVNAVLFIIIMLSVFSVLSVADSYYKNRGVPEKAMCAGILIFFCILLTKSSSMYLFLGAALFFTLAMVRLKNEENLKEKDLSKKLTLIFSVGIAVICTYIVLAIAYCRYKAYAAPNFDFGIFCNMYYNIKRGFSPVTTCERDKLLSHFAVHMSPALYILFPIYLIFPFPATINICQVLAIYSGIIPFLLIAKKYNLNNKVIVLLSAVYAASPILAGGTLFDFHENCLLVPFLMWTFYFYEKNKTVPFFIFAALTLLVKEDAFIYICVFAAYIIVSKKEYIRGAIMIVFSVMYFVFACRLLINYGTGIMAGRFDAMINNGDGLLGIIKTVLFNPGYSTETMLSTKDDTADKLFYVIKMMFPLALMPFMTKKSSRLILILPICLNLFTHYAYQYDIMFQYSFGICTLLLYAALINTADLKESEQKFTSGLSAGLAVMLFFMIIIPKYGNYVNNYKDNKETYEKMDAILDEIPKDKSVSASTFLIPRLSDRKEIYEAYYHGAYDTDYLIIDVRPGYAAESLGIAAKYEDNGYVLAENYSDMIMIYTSPEMQKNN